MYRLWRCSTHFADPTLPAFDDSVTAARRLHADLGAASRLVLARALTDRAMLLITAHRYPEALVDYEEALGHFGTP
ncbi:hypothetical protein Lfu02_41500 [Longispora fulva]|uniref:Tetratricopeptide repeat protein n=1 Tax=Longispora fulva TaxID=619741 RepID=A0A8J7KJ71_9ACTN|nr:tetratricopeptide repeat protein [Longispora fulva]MBG6136609.1 hypothetical protein [Longispora fulva]GIG59778.1 hypothetical protein Lfu02_41500 [Longispora fulva]